MDVIMFWLGVWHRSLVWLPLLDDWSDYLYHLFAVQQQQLNCLWISSWLLTVANLTIKVSGPWSLYTSWCRPVWATKEVLKEGRGQQSLRKQYKEELGTANSSGVLSLHWHSSFNALEKPATHTKSSVMHFQWMLRVFLPLKYNHPVKTSCCEDAGKNETRRLLPAKKS